MLRLRPALMAAMLFSSAPTVFSSSDSEEAVKLPITDTTPSPFWIYASPAL